MIFYDGKEEDDDETTVADETDVDIIEDVKNTKNIIVNIPEGIQEEFEVFKRGGNIKPIEDKIKLKKDHMQVLDDKGTILMNIIGGERIFSRKHTQQLVDMAKKVKQGTATSAELGKLMNSILEIQNTQEPEYVYE
jgi:hypothetical protein